MTAGDAEPDEVLAVELLRADPSAPADPARFSADGAVGPGCYPQGPPMVPAAAPPSTARLRADLARGGAGPERWAADEGLLARCADASLAASLAFLDATVGAPLLPLVVGGGAGVARFVWGDVGSRVAGRDPADAGVVVVSARYRHEHPALVSGSVLHQLCSPVGSPSSRAREVLLHGLLAVVQAQLLDVLPELADAGTELARRQHTLVLTLLHSRPRGSASVRMVAPDGAGTIPGGAPAMQTPDLASVPFAPDRADGAAPPTLVAVLSPWIDPPEGGWVLGWPLVAAVDAGMLDAVLPPARRARVEAALGVLAGPAAAVARFTPPPTMRR